LVTLVGVLQQRFVTLRRTLVRAVVMLAAINLRELPMLPTEQKFPIEDGSAPAAKQVGAVYHCAH
jgi:hypothetical protein